MDRQIRDQLYIALENIEAPAELLGILGCWGDDLSDSDVLAMLQVWNETGEIPLELEPIH
jgi:hypothetical protein